MDQLSHWVRRGGDFLAIIATACLFTSMVVVTWMIVRRNLGGTNYWELETAIYLAVAAVFLGSPYTLRTGGHIGMDLLETTLQEHQRRLLHLTGAVIGLSVCAFLTWFAVEKTWHAFVTNERELGIFAPPLWPKFFAMAIGMALTTLQYVCQGYAAIINLRVNSHV